MIVTWIQIGRMARTLERAATIWKHSVAQNQAEFILKIHDIFHEGFEDANRVLKSIEFL